MPFLDHFSERTGLDPRIDLGGSDALMTEEFLHVSDGRSAFEEMSRKRVPQHMRADPDPKAAAGPPDHDADRLSTKTTSARGQEQGPAITPLSEERP